MAIKEKTWEERIAYAKKVNAQKNTAEAKTASAVKPVSASSQTKSWEERIAYAKQKSAETLRAKQEEYKKTDEYKFASENEDRLKKGMGLKAHKGQVYSFSAPTYEQISSSLDWTDSEIAKIRENGGFSSKLGAFLSGVGAAIVPGGNTYSDVEDMYNELNELQQSRAVLSQYKDAMQYEKDIARIAENDADALFTDLVVLNTYDDKIEKSGLDSSVETSFEDIEEEEAADGIHGADDALGIAWDLTKKVFGIGKEDKAEDAVDWTVDWDSKEWRLHHRDEVIKALLAKGYTAAEIESLTKAQAKKVNNEMAENTTAQINKLVDNHPVIGGALVNAGSVLMSPVRGITSFQDFITGGTDSTLAAGDFLENLSTESQNAVISHINETSGSKADAAIKTMLFKAGVSFAESAVGAASYGSGYSYMMFFSGAMPAYKEAKARGLSEGASIATGIVSGLVETLSEKIPFDELGKFAKSVGKADFGAFVANTIKQAGIEGGTEGISEIASSLYDFLINGGYSDFERFQSGGGTTGEFFINKLWELGETVAVGALSGAGMTGAVGAPAAAVNDIISAGKDTTQGYVIDAIEGHRGEVLKDAKNSGVILRNKAAKVEKNISKGIVKGKEASYYRKIGEINRKVINQQRGKNIDSILSSEDFKSLKRSERNAIRSSVLTQMNNPDIVSKEQKDVLETDNAKRVLQKMQELEYSHMKESDSKRLKDNAEKAGDTPRTSSEVRKAVLNEQAEKLVKNTFEAKNADGYTVEAGAVRSITDGEFEVVQDSSGATAKLSELKIYDSEASELYSELQRLSQKDIPMSVEAVNVALSMYDPHKNKSARAYALWAYDAFKAASYKKNDTVLTFREFEELYHGNENNGEANYKGDITEEQLKNMYETGIGKLELKPGVTKIGHKGLSKHQTEQVFIIDQLAKKYGRKVVLVDNRLTDSDGNYVNALYKSSSDTIVLSLINSNDLLLVHFGHEMFHYLKSNSLEKGQYLQNKIISILKSDSKYDFEGIYKQVSEVYEGLSGDDILEEIAAQYMAVALSNEKTIKRIVNEATDTEKSFIQEIVDYLKQFIKDVKALIKLYGASDKTVRAAVETPVEQLEYIAEQFDVALSEAAKIKKPATATGGVKYSKQKPKKNSAKSKKSYYNESATILTIWANSESTPVGSVLRQKIKGKTRFYLKTENGAVEISKQNYVEKDDNYGKIIDSERNTNGKTDSEFSTSAKRRSNRNVPMDGNGGNAGPGNKNAGRIETNKSISDSRRGMAGDRDDSAKSSESSEFQDDKSGYKFSRQLISDTEAGIEQMKLENESFFQYLDRLGNSIGQKIKEKRTPGSSLVYDREAFYDIARKYNLLDSEAGGWFKSSKYSDTELVNVMENIMVGISDELISPEAGLSRLARIQEEILKTGYELKYGKDLNGVEIKAETAKSFKQDIRNKPIYVSQYTFSKLMEQYGTRRNLRAASFHQLSIKEEDSDNTPNVDLLYGEIQKKYPNLLTDVTEQLDMINELISTERAVQPQVEYISEKEGFKGFLDLSEAAVRRAADMLTEAFNVELKQGDLQAQYKELRGVRQTLDRTKKYYRDLLNDSAKIRAEREQKAILAKRILRVSRRLDKLLRKETDYKHIPEGLKQPVAKFLQIIKGSITNSFGESLIDTSLSLAELNKAYEAYGYEDTMHPDESYAEKLSQLQFVLHGNKRLKDLSLGELETVEEIVTHINYLVNEGNKTFVDMQKRGYEHVASVSTEEVFAHKEERKKGLEKIKDFDYKNLTPYMFFKMVGTRFEGSEEVTEVLGELGNALFKGEEKTARNVEQVKKKTQEIMKTWGYDSRWLSDKRDFVFESGQKASMTTENIMNVLATYDREEASGFKTDHILAGGIVVNESSHKTVSDYIKPLPETIKTRYLFNKARKERKERLKNNKGKIFVGMTDAERAKVLKETALPVVNATDIILKEDLNGQVEELKKKYDEKAFQIARELGKKFDVFKDYSTENIKLNVYYSIGSLHKSVNEVERTNSNFNDFVKMLAVFEEVVKNAQPVEVHTDKYKGTKKENTNLKQDYVLLSAFQDGKSIIPVEFHIKEFKVGVKNQLYVSVNLKRIEASFAEAVRHKSPDASPLTSVFRLTDIISNVNPLDSEFLKYIPASMLDEQQVVGRNEGIRKEKLRIAEIERTGDVNVSVEVTEDEQKALAGKIAESMRVYISKKDIDMLRAQLTPIQVGYYKALVREMSEHGADMGNEVSRLLHGTKKFNEENYCPVTAVSDYLLERFGNKDVGERRLKNRSFTKRLTENANVPILIDNMSEVYAKHMYEMCTYNGMTIPLESIERLLNYKLPDEREFVDGKWQIKKGKSYRELFREAFGDRGLNYLENLMKDLNGGIKTDNRGALNSMITNFKRSAVSASLTVAFQQPGAVARAMFRINPQYFTPTAYMPLLDNVTGKYTDYFDRYDELLKYCPLAVIKDIGKFDTNVGQSYEEWILDVKPKFRRSIKEVDRIAPWLYHKTEDLFMWLPGYLDKATWLHIWNAVKRETAHKNGVKVKRMTEKMLNEAGERMSQVIRETQVYDSVLSRSDLMRSKNPLAQMATAFMAEPTVTYNLMRYAAVTAKHQPKVLVRAVASVLCSIILTDFLKSLAKAFRYDDEETDYEELVLSGTVVDIISDLNPLTYIPYAKDIWSLFEGYDIERVDMSVFSKVIDALKPFMDPEKETGYEEWEQLIVTLSMFTGIPVNNLWKDISGLKAKFKKGSPDFSISSAGNAIRDGLSDNPFIKVAGKIFPPIYHYFDMSDGKILYHAILNDDESVIERYRRTTDEYVDDLIDQGYSESDAILKATDNAENNFHNKVIEGLISEDIRIQEAAEALQGFEYSEYEELVEELTALGFDKNDVIKAVDKYISSVEEKTYTPSGGGNAQMYEYEDLHKAVEAEKLDAVGHVVARLKEAGKEDKNIRSSLTGKFKDVYIAYCADGNDSGMQRLKELLKACDVGYTDKTFSDWEKEYLKNK